VSQNKRTDYESMEAYYRERATVYDEFYQVGRRKDDLVALRSWVVERVQDGTILEVAAGTGYWTEIAAPVAKAITATDYNSEMLAIAAQRRLGSHVTLIAADAYRLPKFPGTFDVGMAMLWLSHIQKQRRREFLSHFTSRLAPGALVLMFDQFYIEGVSNPISRKDEWDNLYTVRRLPNGAKYEIVKNYPSDEELIDAFSDVCDNIAVTRLREFWTVSARVRH
jgi:ubiquinone/menaquinone biosynthesis C-methylase UbiE